MATTERVLSAVDSLKRELEATRSQFSLEDIPDLVAERREATLVSNLAADDDDKTAIDKWFSIVENRSSSPSDVSAATVTADDDTVEYVLVRSRMYSRRKQKQMDDDDGYYYALWVVGRDESDAQEYFIHRVDWRQAFDTPLDAAAWSVSDVRSWLGFDAYLPEEGENLEFGVTYLVQGDLTLELSQVDEYVTTLSESRIENRIHRDKQQHKKQQVEEWIEQTDIGSQDGITVSSGYPSRLSVRIGPSSTEDLKDLQSKLGVSEDKIRELMKNDWSRLTAKRRKNLLETWVRNQFRSFKRDLKIDKGELTEDEAATIQEDIKRTSKRQNAQLGNHLVTISNAAPSQRPDREQKGVMEVVVPDKTQLQIIHDEHPNISRTVPRSVLSLDLLERHERA
jgi:polyhydroxyalkanoate synthesis regulator phasin